MSRPATSSEFVRVPVERAWDETPSLRVLRLDLSALGGAYRQAGQVIRIRPAGSGRAAWNGQDGLFALASAPRPDGSVDVLVKRGGEVADAVLAEALPAGSLEVTPPLGAGFPTQPANGCHVLLFAAGSGIAPVRALIEQLGGARQKRARVILFYGQRAEGDFAFRGEFGDWQRLGVELVLCCSQPTEAWPGARGYVQHVARASEFAGVPLDRAVAYLSGPSEMIVGVRSALGSAGLPADRSFLNY